ncbi:hypothetical protein HG536_0A02770 [Torulaspora globosa]|uniref:UDP-N-acetylglucosamine diphosphorylase n=1 Tax=Torulaspora globosa TaxID=48254 RepID=A0A7G3ZAC4_9SACH|nr:uncharacterized protein HG536_0A02770 [Torulaspora globosa]QLL30460.1 hypothetical protein HG536_0A02770 [Torulaspora globosa]
MEVKKLYEEAGQLQLFDHWETLSAEDQQSLLENLSAVAKRTTPQELVSKCRDALTLSAANASDGTQIEPLPTTSYQTVIGNEEAQKAYWNLGLEAIVKGEVAVILMAGGQGTRLGSSQPKGCYDIGLPSGKSLFQIQADKILRLQDLSGSQHAIPWYVMTSVPTRAATEEFFAKHKFFGLKPSQVTFFNQGTLPAFDLEGSKLLLGSPTELVASPDGNGGLYRAMKDNDLLSDFTAKGIKHVYMYCVDNVLSKVADPTFIGFAIQHKFELATKAVRKRDAHESVGLIATKQGKPCVIEYSEIPKELAEAQDGSGLLKFRAANIVNHYYSVELLQRELDNWCATLPYHVARKKIPVYDNKTGQFCKPTSPNGIKLEQFIFDVFPTVPLDKFGCLEVERAEEFAPLKNGAGSSNDNPETSRVAYLTLGTSRLKAAGAKIASGVDIEVSGRMSFSGENLSQYSGKTFDRSGVIIESDPFLLCH